MLLGSNQIVFADGTIIPMNEHYISMFNGNVIYLNNTNPTNAALSMINMISRKKMSLQMLLDIDSRGAPKDIFMMVYDIIDNIHDIHHIIYIRRLFSKFISHLYFSTRDMILGKDATQNDIKHELSRCNITKKVIDEKCIEMLFTRLDAFYWMA